MPKRKFVNVATDAVDWLRAIASDGETRYYVNSPTGKSFAKEFDAKSDPILVRGHGLINTRVSGLYTEKLYPSLAAARDAAQPLDSDTDATPASEPSPPTEADNGPTTPGPAAPSTTPYRRKR